MGVSARPAPSSSSGRLPLHGAAPSSHRTSGSFPISPRRLEKDIEPVDAVARAALARDLLANPLYRYRYLDEAASVAPRLGFMIDDDPSSPLVRPDGEHVDLYGYTTMAVATIQAQQAKIEWLKAEISPLRSRLDAMEAKVRWVGGSRGPVYLLISEKKPRNQDARTRDRRCAASHHG